LGLRAWAITNRRTRRKKPMMDLPRPLGEGRKGETEPEPAPLATRRFAPPGRGERVRERLQTIAKTHGVVKKVKGRSKNWRPRTLPLSHHPPSRTKYPLRSHQRNTATKNRGDRGGDKTQTPPWLKGVSRERDEIEILL